MKKQKYLKQIPDSMAVEAAQVLANYCMQNAHSCNECMWKMKDDSCAFRGEIYDRFTDWKYENNIGIVNKRK